MVMLTLEHKIDCLVLRFSINVNRSINIAMYLDLILIRLLSEK